MKLFDARYFKEYVSVVCQMLGDVVRFVWMVFGNDKLTTKEVEFRLASLFDYHCPDDFAKTMMKLKQAGFVKGEVSVEKGGWIWWVDEECRKKGLCGVR